MQGNSGYVKTVEKSKKEAREIAPKKQEYKGKQWTREEKRERFAS